MSHQLQIILKGEVIERWPVPLGNSTVGSGSGCSLVLQNDRMQTIEAEHIELRCTPAQCEVQDLDSLNGTQLNDDLLEAHRFHMLQPGDVIKVGGYKLVYEQVEAAETAVSTPTPAEPAPLEAETPSAPPTSPPKPQEKPARVTSKTKPAPPDNEPPNLPPAPPDSPSEPPEPVLPFSQHHNDDNIHSRYLQYLPGIYHMPFVARYLALLESLLAPIEWNIANFDLFLDPNTAPALFLPWLANWFDMAFDETWSEAQRREFLCKAHEMQPRIGTAVALTQLLTIYTQVEPAIDDTSDDLPEATFRVTLPLPPTTPLRDQIMRLIDAYKPAFTTYELVFTGEQAA